MNFIGGKCKFNHCNVTNKIRQNVEANPTFNLYESTSNNGNNSSQNLISVQTPQTTSNTNNNNNNNRQINFDNSSVEFTGPVFNGCPIEKVIIINDNDNDNDCNIIETGNDGYKSWNLDQIMRWINSLDNGKYIQYSKQLKKGFEKSEIFTGDLLPELTPLYLSIDPFNITQFGIKIDLANHFQSLKNNNNKIPNITPRRSVRLGNKSKNNNNKSSILNNKSRKRKRDCDSDDLIYIGQPKQKKIKIMKHNKNINIKTHDKNGAHYLTCSFVIPGKRFVYNKTDNDNGKIPYKSLFT